MIKLDQLNFDIEEALSANSSPCGTPGTTRKTQVSALTGSVTHGYTLCVASGSMQMGCHALCCSHSCHAYAAYLFMLDFLKSIYFALGIERPIELSRQMPSIPMSSNPPASLNPMTSLYGLPVRLYGSHLSHHLATMSLFCSVCLKFLMWLCTVLLLGQDGVAGTGCYCAFRVVTKIMQSRS